MRIIFFLGVGVWIFQAGINYGLTKQARALEGCEIVASQVAKDVTKAEGKAAMCDDLLNNLGALGDTNATSD